MPNAKITIFAPQADLQKDLLEYAGSRNIDIAHSPYVDVQSHEMDIPRFDLLASIDPPCLYLDSDAMVVGKLDLSNFKGLTSLGTHCELRLTKGIYKTHHLYDRWMGYPGSLVYDHGGLYYRHNLGVIYKADNSEMQAIKEWKSRVIRFNNTGNLTSVIGEIVWTHMVTSHYRGCNNVDISTIGMTLVSSGAVIIENGIVTALRPIVHMIGFIEYPVLHQGMPCISYRGQMIPIDPSGFFEAL